MRVEGGCHCGRVRYEAEVEPGGVVVCHCTDCQTLSGSAFRTVVPTRPGAFALLSGTLTVYVKTAASGNARQQAFCPTCGTPIYSAPPGEGQKVFALRVGSIRERDRLAPRRQFWRRSALGWLATLPEIPGFDAQPAFDADGGIHGR